MTVDGLLPPPAPGTYGCLLADPPWAFASWSGVQSTPHRTGTDHYSTMAAGDLRALPIADWAARDAVLFLWAVDSNLPEALALGAAWGFTFKTVALVWLKGWPGEEPPISMGFWTRKQTEQCLLFTRGKPRRLSRGVRQLLWESKREHSRKPDEQYNRIEALVAGPRLEMFARSSRPGWDSWGLETGKFDRQPAAPVGLADF